MNFFLQFPHLLSDWGEIWYNRSTRNFVDHVWFFLKLVSEGPYISDDCKCSNIYVCTIKL
jgi:hypothetical protein